MNREIFMYCRESESIDVYITTSDLEKLHQYVDFLPVVHYSKHDVPACKEVGKIGIMGGPVLRFHLKRTEIPIETHEEILKKNGNKDYSLLEMITMAKQSEYGAVWYSDKGPIQIMKDGTMHAI